MKHFYIFLTSYIILVKARELHDVRDESFSLPHTQRISDKGTAGTIVQSSLNPHIADSRRDDIEKSLIHHTFSSKFNHSSRTKREPFRVIPTRSIVVDPIFVDLDDFHNFNDISDSMRADEEFLATPPPPFIPVTVEDELLESSFSEQQSTAFNTAQNSFRKAWESAPIAPVRAVAPLTPPTTTSRTTTTTTTTPRTTPRTTSTTTTTTKSPPTTPRTTQRATTKTLIPTTLKIFEDRRTQLQRISDFSSHFPTTEIDEMTARTTLPTSPTIGIEDEILSSSFPIPTEMIIPRDEDPEFAFSQNEDSHSLPKSQTARESFPITQDDDRSQKTFLPQSSTTTERTTVNPLWWTPRPAFIGQTSVQLFNKRTIENIPSQPNVVQLSSDQQSSPKRLSQWGRTQPLEERKISNRNHYNRNSMYTGRPMKKPLSSRPHHLTSAPSSRSSVISGFSPQPLQNLLPKYTGNMGEKEILNELESLASQVHLNDLKNVFKQNTKHSEASNWNKADVDSELVSKRNALRQLELLKDLHEKHVIRNLPKFSILPVNRLTVPKDIDEVDMALRELGLSSESSKEDLSNNVNVLDEKNQFKQGLSRKSISQLTSRYKLHKMNSGLQIFERNALDRNLMQGYGYTGRRLRTYKKPMTFIAIPPSSPQRIYSVPGSELLPTVARSEVESVEQLVHSLKRRDDAPNVCQLAKCNFEDGYLCNWESSFDETTRVVRRVKRQNLNDEKFFVMRSWSNWMGHPNNSVIAIDKAPIFSDSNKHFAGIVLNAQQRGSLSLRLNHETSFKLRFRGYDVRPATKLKVCCDDSCFVSSRDPGKHQWKKLQVECPAKTQQVSFECLSGGPYRGACGVDDISILSDTCT